MVALLIGITSFPAGTQANTVERTLLDAWGGEATTLAQYGDKIVAGIGGRVFTLYVDAESEQLVPEYKSAWLGGSINEIKVVGELAYVAAGAGGLQVLDIGARRPDAIARIPVDFTRSRTNQARDLASPQ